MTSDKILDLVLMFLVPMFIILVPLYIGQRYGLKRAKQLLGKEHSPIGTIVSAALGLLAFMLAFTFQIASNRYADRKDLMIEEVTNIRTTYLRAGLVPEPFRSGTRKLLIEYVDLRIELASDISKLVSAKAGTQRILDTLWNYTERLAEQDRSSEVYSLYTTSVNDLVDNYNQRITISLEYRMPVSVLYTLFVITFLTMLVLGFEIGISGKGNFSISFLLSIIFGIVMFLILALDRPELGLTKLDQTAVHTLKQQLQVMQQNGR